MTTRTPSRSTFRGRPCAPAWACRAGQGADYSCFAGAGAFLSTPSDLVRLGSAMLKPGLLTAETIKLFQTPLQLESGASTGFALGWKVDTHPACRCAGAAAASSSHSYRWHRLALVVSGSPSGDCDDDQRLHAVAVDAFALQVGEAFVR